MPLYSLWVLETETPSGPGELLISSLPYRPDAGPYAGRPFLALWEETSAANWNTATQGLGAGENGIVLPVGVADRVPSSLVLQNPRRFSDSDERKLDDWFKPGYAIKGKAEHYLVEVPAYDAPPLWADFGPPVFTGRVSKKSEPGDLVTVYVNSSASITDTPHLTKRFTGGGTTMQIVKEVPIPVPLGLAGSDWTIQIEGAARAIGGQTSWLYIEDGATNVLINFYAEGGTAKLSVYNGAGTDTYNLNTGVIPTSAFRPVRITLSWSETTNTVRAWLDKTLTLETPILTPVSNAAEITANISKTTAAPITLPFTSFCYLRLWTEALFTDGVVDYSEPDFTAPTLARSYEFDDIDTAEVIADAAPNGKHIDLTSFINGTDYIWLGSPSAFIGDANKDEQLIPYAYGDVWHVPLFPLNELYNERALGCAAAETVAVFGNGAQHVQSADTVVYGNPAIVNADTGTVTVDPSRTVVFDDYCRLFAKGQRVRFYGGFTAFTGQTPVIRAIIPNPSHTFKLTRSDKVAYSLRVEGLTPSTGVFVEDPFLDTPAGDEDFSQPWLNAQPNPYGGTGESPVYRFNRPTNEPVTANIKGDPTQLVTNLPGFTYVSPSTVGNVISQMVTLNLGWGVAEYNMPAYSVLPQYVGYYVRDKSITTRKAINDVLQGLGWLEEGTDGKHTLKAYNPPTGNPAFTFIQDEVVDVQRLPKFSREGEEDIPTSIDVGYRRSYTVVDGGSLPDVTLPVTRDYLTREYRVREVGTPTVGVTSLVFNTQLNAVRQAIALGKNVLDLTRGEAIEITYRYGAKKMFQDFTLGMEVEGDLPDFGYPQFGNKGGIVVGFSFFPYQGIVKITVAIPEVS